MAAMLGSMSNATTFVYWCVAIALAAAVISGLLWAAKWASGTAHGEDPDPLVCVMTASGAGASVFTLVLAFI